MPGQYSVYVVALEADALKHASFREANPNHIPGKPCLYVGMTSKTPDERFQQHKSGYKASKYVKRYGKWLRRRLYEHHNPLTHDQAVELEVTLAESLRDKGYAVWQK
jgi:hypothetical protein